MPAGHGTRARTRDSFSRPFRGKGYIPLSVYLRTYKIGDYVDIKVNSAVMKVLHSSCFCTRTSTCCCLDLRRRKDVAQHHLAALPSWFAGCCRVCRTRCTTAGQA